MSVVGDQIAKATAAGVRAAQLAQLAHCPASQRDSIRWWLLVHGGDPGAVVLGELETRWKNRDREARCTTC